jgi:deoxyribonuclease V
MPQTRISVHKLHEMQKRLSTRVIREDLLSKNLCHVAGVDAAYFDKWAIGTVAVLNYASLSIVETRKARVKTDFPYIPTLLSFRELKPAQAAIRKLKTSPDVLMVDAQGIAHPYRLGFASHLGLVLDKPTIGVAKSLLIGQVGDLNHEGWAPIIDKKEIVGAAVRRTDSEQPIYVSIGHKVSMERAIDVVRHCTKLSRIPEPIRIAHILAAEEKEKYRRKAMAQS